jgi:Zn finger protein HypA/HybF involved in hydrogenase expression
MELEEEAVRLPPQPVLGWCDECGSATLRVRLNGREITLDAAEVVNQVPCPLCKQVLDLGNQRSRCWRCGDTRWIGEDLPAWAVLLDELGVARVGSPADGRLRGDAVHRVHACGVRLTA